MSSRLAENGTPRRRVLGSANGWAPSMIAPTNSVVSRVARNSARFKGQPFHAAVAPGETGWKRISVISSGLRIMGT